MATESRTITIDADSELGHALDESNGYPIVLLRGDKRFRVTPDPEDLWANYDPDEVLEGLREIAGTISAEEAERMKEIVYRGREEGTRPITRP